MNGNGNTPVLALRGVSKSFGAVKALTDIDFEVHDGEVVALVGDNGAGKSTMVKTIAGIHGADNGQILFEGQEVKINSPTDATDLGIATVYQDLALCDNLDVVENLFLGREEASGPVRQLDETAMEKRANDLLSRLAVTITDVRAEVGMMSGGQRQQVAIARSLLGEPEGRDARRADRRARCASDGDGAVPDQAAARGGSRRGRDQPQPGRRVRGGRPHLRSPARAKGGRLRRG